MNGAPHRRHQFTLWQLLGALTAVAVTLGVAAPWLRELRREAALFWLSALAWCMLLVAIIRLGSLPLRSRCAKSAAAAEALAHGVGGLSAMGWLVLCVPPVARIFREFDVDLPPSTRWLLLAGHFAYSSWYVAVPCILAFLALDAAVFWKLDVASRSPNAELASDDLSRACAGPLASAWSASITMVLVIAVAFAPWAIVRVLMWPL